jgi:hypothetical protein
MRRQYKQQPLLCQELFAIEMRAVSGRSCPSVQPAHVTPKLLSCTNGHYRGGRRKFVILWGFDLNRGDFLWIAREVPSGEAA